MIRIIAGVNLDANWIDAVIVVAIIAVFYLIATRRGTGATVGETLLSADYVRHLRASTPGSRSHRHQPLPPPDQTLGPAALRFRALGDTRQLKIASVLADGDRTLSEVADAAGVGEPAALYHLAQLQRAGVVRVQGSSEEGRYHLEEHLKGALLELFDGRHAKGAPPLSLPGGE